MEIVSARRALGGGAESRAGDMNPLGQAVNTRR